MRVGSGCAVSMDRDYFFLKLAITSEFRCIRQQMCSSTEKPILSISDFHPARALLVAVRHVIDPRAYLLPSFQNLGCLLMVEHGVRSMLGYRSEGCTQISYTA